MLEPSGVAVDPYGNQYVVNNNPSAGSNTSNIDIFDPAGHYIGGFNVNNSLAGVFSTVNRTSTAAVDSTGHLYLTVGAAAGCCAFEAVVRYDPTTYNPEAGEIEYGSPPVTVTKEGANGIATNALNDHLYLDVRHSAGHVVIEYGPPTDGVPNDVVTEDIGKGELRFGNTSGPVAIDAERDRLYVIDEPAHLEPGEVRIDAFSLAPPYKLLKEYDGSTTPGGKVHPTGPSEIALTVDEASGNFFVSYRKSIYEMEPDGTYVATISEPKFSAGAPRQLAYDNSEQSPNRGYLYAPSGVAVGHLYAFELKLTGPPEIESLSFGGVSEDEAVLHATVDPGGEPTHYVFEYTTQADFDEQGFEGALLAGEGDIEPGSEGVAVSAATRGLDPGTAYRFRVRVENQCEPGGCAVEEQSSFTTFAPYGQSGACANQALRTGNSAPLPDCRAYELVTPGDTGGRAPFTSPASSFAYWTGSPDGSSVAFNGDGGAYPGQDTPGGYNGDIYVSRRGVEGWRTEAVGLLGRHSASQIPGGVSSDHGYTVVRSFAAANLEGELGGPGEEANYIRYPDGTIHLAGEGSLGQAKVTGVAFISEGGGHIFLTTEETQLEPGAPPAGTTAIYDRTPDGTVHVVSLLPGDVTPSEDAHYEGASADGATVAFKLGDGPIYLRLDNAETVEGAPAGARFAGLSEDGHYLFYLLGGDLYRYDTQADASTALSESGDVTPAYVSADGLSAYFTSPSVLPSPGAPAMNPQGKAPVTSAKGSGVLGAKGTGTLKKGSSKVTGVSVGEGALKVGMQISGTGIAADTTITAVRAGALTLSQAADQSGATSFIATGSSEVTAVSTDEGTFEVGMRITGVGIPAGTTITAVGAGTLTLSEKTTTAGSSQLTASPANLYLAREGELRFLGTVTARDAEGEVVPTLGTDPVHGFAQWLGGIDSSGWLPLRATADGQVLLFESRADLTEFESGGKAQIYRYDAGEETLDCLSCSPTGQEPGSDATLLSPDEMQNISGSAPISRFSIVPNLSTDGRRAFFESDERLVPADEDGFKDVYEWEAEGKGSCAQPGGCLVLITSGQSARDDFLYGASESGDDVFIYTSDSLNGEDTEEAPSVYDARVEGGFPPRQAPAGECQGEACQPAAVVPNDPTPASSAFEGSGNVKPEGEAKARCPKGKKAARRGGKSRCVPRQSHKKKSHKRANTNRRAGR